MGRHLSDDIIHRIKLHIEASEDVTTIAKAVRVSRKTIYKLRLNLDIWGEPYAPPTIVLG
jgi:DNA-binding phage protein